MAGTLSAGAQHVGLQGRAKDGCGCAGLLDLHAVCGDVRWLRWALELQATLDSLFWDPAAGGRLYLLMPMASQPLLSRHWCSGSALSVWHLEAERLDSHVLQKPTHTIEHRNAEFQACS